jgi:predicted dithiol-disulfide oxidoreductase (DUF899 family)
MEEEKRLVKLHDELSARKRALPWAKIEPGEVFHTYGTFGRGGEQFLGIFAYLDVLPKGREEYGPRHSLPDWAKVRTEY